ncbi:MAG: hypothetical protein DMG12_09810 [Acidobacteria bacterium]|nr:MAG: hypothetical protein DMG12_09810 [Acidobacteriota bacterium]
MYRHLPVFAILLVTIAFLPAVTSSDSAKEDNEFTYARIRYHMTDDAIFVREVPWHHDYPFGDEAFPAFLKEVTRVHTQSSAYQIVDIDSPELFKYPFAYLCEPGYLDLNKKDAGNLREYLDRGGFVMVDDFRGSRHLENLVRQMKKVYPNRDIIPLDVSHPIFNSFYMIESLDMKPPYGNMPVQFLGLQDDHGRLQMVIDYNNDLSEFWEWLDRGELPLHDAALSLKFGVNYVMYAMTH